MGEDSQPQLAAAVQNAQIAGVVKVYPLVDWVELDPSHSQGRDAGELRFPAAEVGMHTAKGPQAGLRPGIVEAGGGVVHMDHLTLAGGHRKDQAAVNARPAHGGAQSGFGAVGEGRGMAHGLELFNGGGGNFVWEGVGVNIENHEDNSFLGA